MHTRMSGCLYLAIALSVAACDDTSPTTTPDTCTDCNTDAKTEIAEPDPCEGISCDVPPDSCHEVGACIDGLCEYPTRIGACDDADPCTSGDSCADGVCQGTSIACDEAPAPRCKDADTLVMATTSGATCQDGACNYPSVDVPCERGCADGACVGDPCAGITCDTPPDTCHAARGTCSGGTCSYTPLTGASCDDGDPCTHGDVCESGTCGGQAMACDTPPAPTCKDANTRVVAGSAAGSCSAGSCDYETTETTCSFGCVAGACEPDPCEGVVCNERPDSCHAATGTCTGGVCSYATLSGTFCNDGDTCTSNDRCAAGVCQGTTISCSDLPTPICSNNTTRVTYTAVSALCQNGGCDYTPIETQCTHGCANGACLGDPCAGVTCNTPPDSCHAAVGTCDAGQCSYAPLTGNSCNDADGCTVSDICTNGVCGGAPRTCDAPPAATCRDANTALKPAATGSCASSTCDYPMTPVACPFGCDAGLCLPDPCANGACEPPTAVLVCNPTEIDVDDEVIFVASASSDGFGTLTDYRFDYGDGTFEDGATTQRAHVYATEAVVTVTLTVTNDRGYRATDSCEVTVTQPFVGSLAFDPAVTTPTASSINQINIVDYNDDGLLDLLVGGGTGQIVIGHGDGRFVQNIGGTLPSASVGPVQSDFVSDYRNTGSVVTADVNGDGHTDFITAMKGVDALYLQLGTGSALAPGVTITTQLQGAGGKPTTLAVADFDGDTVPDVVTASKDLNLLTFLKGDGAGGFVTKRVGSTVRSGAGQGPAHLALGDIDGDEVLDVVTTNEQTSTLSFVRGVGAGSFAAAVVIPVQSEGCGAPRYVVLRDLDDDGDDDAIVACGSGGVLLLEADGDTLLVHHRIATTTAAQLLRFVDMNGDHQEDLVVDSGSKFLVIPKASGAFEFGSALPAVSSRTHNDMTVGDIDGDGHADVVTVGSCGCLYWDPPYYGQTNHHSQVCIHAGSSTGALAAVRCTDIAATEEYVAEYLGTGLRSVAVGEITGDGVLDVIAVAGTGQWWQVEGVISGCVERSLKFSGGAAPVGIYPFSGKAEPFALYYGAFVRYRHEWMFEPNFHSTEYNSAFVGLGQMDADASPELFDVDGYGYNGELQLGYSEAGEVTYTTRYPNHSLVFNTYKTAQMVFADLNGDDVNEAVAVGTKPDGSGAGVAYTSRAVETPFALEKTLPLVSSSPATHVVVGYVGDDELVDIVVLQPAIGRVSVFYGLGAELFSAPQALSFVEAGITELPIGLAVGDFNGDGFGDIATVNAQSNRLFVRSGANDDFAVLPLSGTPTAIGTADLDNDGVDDLVMGVGSSIQTFRGMPTR